MNHFERVAIFTVVESIENQLRGLKTLIAASDPNNSHSHKVTKTLDNESHELDESEEEELEKNLAIARENEIKRMSTRAEGVFQDEFQTVLKGMADLDG